MTFEIKRGQPVAVSLSILSKLKKNYDRREFVDYVKYLFRPEKEEKDLRICIERIY
jgi:hypothetical protein